MSAPQQQATFCTNKGYKVGCTITSYYYFNGQRVAMRVQSDANTTGVVTWLHGDMLGSASVATDASGNKISGSDARYMPYGEARSGFAGSGLPTDRRFTGQISVAGGLIDMNARVLDPLLGRFISADTIVPNPADPQSLNRFAFVTNNPLKYNDPTGHQGNCVLMGSCPSPFYGSREGAELVGYLIGLGYVTANAVAPADSSLSTPLNVAPTAPNNTAHTSSPAIDAAPALGYPLGPVQSVGTVETYPVDAGNTDLKLTTPIDSDSTLQIGGALTSDTAPGLRNASYAGKTYYPSNPKMRQKYLDGVRFNENGFADFSPYARSTVEIEYTGDRMKDERAANKAAGFKKTPTGWTWHLVPSDLHRSVGHTGGFSLFQRRDDP